MAPRFALITDTTADLSDALCKEHNIYMIPQIIIWGREVLIDTVNVTSAQFYNRLKSTNDIPTTSRPVPVDTAELFKRAREETGAEDIVVLTVSEKVSGTYSSALEAQRMVDFPEHIHILDTRSVTLALGMITLRVAEARDQGATAAEAIELARTLSANSHALFSPGTLEFLHRGGRIGAARHLIGTALSIKPILHLVDGQVEALENVRTRKRALKRMIELVEEQVDPTKPLYIGIMHGDAPAEAAQLGAEIQQRWQPALFLESWVSPSIGVHVGPGVIGISFVQ